VRFADDDPTAKQKSAGVIVTLGIYSDVHLRTNERCHITSNLLGDAILQFIPGGSSPSNEFVQNGDYQEGTVAANPLRRSAISKAASARPSVSVASAGNDVGRLARHLDGFLVNNTDPLQRIVVKTERVLDGFQRTVDSINVLIGDVDAAGVERGEDGAAQPLEFEGPATVPGRPGAPGARRRVVTVPELLAETRDAIIEMRKAVETANRTFANVEQFTAPLGERGEDVMIKVDQAMGRLDELLQQFVTFGQAINRREGTLGQLVNNPDLLPASECRGLQHRANDASAEADHQGRPGRLRQVRSPPRDARRRRNPEEELGLEVRPRPVRDRRHTSRQ